MFYGKGSSILLASVARQAQEADGRSAVFARRDGRRSDVRGAREAKPARPAPSPRRRRGAVRSSRIELVVEPERFLEF